MSGVGAHALRRGSSRRVRGADRASGHRRPLYSASDRRPDRMGGQSGAGRQAYRDREALRYHGGRPAADHRCGQRLRRAGNGRRHVPALDALAGDALSA
ncbi:hypothetical protein D3C72_1278040 [compost metagenome]